VFVVVALVSLANVFATAARVSLFNVGIKFRLDNKIGWKADIGKTNERLPISGV
jgi:hypothetical protein